MVARTSKQSNYKSLGLMGPLLGLYTLLLIALMSVCWAVSSSIEYSIAATMAVKPLPPLYPNAQLVSERFTSTEEEQDIRVVSFITDDKVDVVKAYYEHAMQDAGWGFWGYPFSKAPNTAYYQYRPDDGPTYKVLVQVQATAKKQTAVSIEMYAIGHSWNGESPRK